MKSQAFTCDFIFCFTIIFDVKIDFWQEEKMIIYSRMSSPEIS